MMKLRDLLADEAGLGSGLADLEIGGLTADSRAVRPGDVFVALAGTKADGLRFVAPAVANGAVAVVSERMPDPQPDGVVCIQVENARRTLARAAARLYPGQPAVIAAVTGTSGKTSVAAFTRQIWMALGHPAASVGTVGIVAPNEEIYGSLTTPDPIDLHRTLDRLAASGVTHLALEASSHGLDQHRLDGVRIAVAGFTNLSRDHLDYHPSVEAYLQAKLRLFDDLVTPDGTAVIVTDHEHASAVTASAKKRGLKILDVGHTVSADGIRIVEAVVDGFSQTLQLTYRGQSYRVRLPLVGGFQVENALVAAGFALATGGDPAKVFAALEGLEGAKGRLELAGQRAGAPIFIDYAHKPDALAKALEALRPYAPGRLVVAFGCGGDRDQGKRPLMGEIATKLADRVIVTDDNPRSENPQAIRRAILDAAPGAREIGDRRDAIRTAISELVAGDVLLVAGKGHETGQIVGDEVLPFSDHEAVKTALEELAA